MSYFEIQVNLLRGEALGVIRTWAEDQNKHARLFALDDILEIDHLPVANTMLPNGDYAEHGIITVTINTFDQLVFQGVSNGDLPSGDAGEHYPYLDVELSTDTLCKIADILETLYGNR